MFKTIEWTKEGVRMIDQRTGSTTTFAGLGRYSRSFRRGRIKGTSGSISREAARSIRGVG